MTVSFFSNKWQIKRRKKKTKEASRKDLRELRQKLITGAEKRTQYHFSTFFLMFKRNFSWSKEMSEEISTLF